MLDKATGSLAGAGLASVTAQVVELRLGIRGGLPGRLLHSKVLMGTAGTTVTAAVFEPLAKEAVRVADWLAATLPADAG